MKTSLTYIVVLFLTYILFIVDGNAQVSTSELVTDRPDQTESAMIVPQGALQVETGAMFETQSEAKNHVYNTTLLRYGINKRFEIRLINEYIKLTPEKSDQSLVGFGPLSIGSKIKVSEASGIFPEIAFLGHLTLRTGQNELKPNHIAPDFRFSFEYNLNEKLSLGINLGAQWDGESQNATGIYTLALGAPVTPKIGFYAELYGFKTEQTINSDHRLNAGLTYALFDLFQFDISAGVGLSKKSPDNFISAGASFRLFK